MVFRGRIFGGKSDSVLGVVTYPLFGLTITGIFTLIRIVVTLVVIFFTIRIPFKRRYHWTFLILSLGFFYYSAAQLYATTVPDATIYVGRLLWIYLCSNRLLTLLIFQFVVYFVSGEPNKWMKYVLASGYGYVAVTNWVPFLIDPAFVLTKGFETATGYVSGPGTSDQYLKPFGIDLYVTLMAVPTFYLLLRYLYSQKLPLVRGQTKYLILGLLFVFISAYAVQFARITGGPNLGNLIATPCDFILLLGLMKKGFYSVTPTAETSAAVAPIRYPLVDGRSYLAHDSRAAFEDFTSLVRSGHQGLLITRTFPDDVRKDYGLQTTPIRWLAEEKGEDGIPPGDLLGISVMVKDFLAKATKPVVMLHGIEYLSTRNGFTPVLKLVHGLSESNAAKRGILILPVVPDSLKKQDEALLVAETTSLPMPA